MSYPTSTFEWNGETIQIEWMRMDSVDKLSPITQVYAVCFNEQNEILIGRKGSSWNLPGGTPEGKETIAETLTRECLEEVDAKIKNIHILGAQKVYSQKTPDDAQYQVRCICDFVELLDQTPDPDDGIVWERKFVPIEQANDYLKWGKTGEALFKDALALHKHIKAQEELKTLLKGKYKSVEDLPYRQGAIGIVVNDENEFLIVQMVSYGENQWRFPGGGVEENEKPSEALLREFQEELNTDKFEIVKESKIINKYNWPDFIIVDQIKNKNRFFRGQEQHQFLVKFTGKKEDLKIDPVDLRQVKWVKYNDLQEHFVFDNQWTDAEKALKDFL